MKRIALERLSQALRRAPTPEERVRLLDLFPPVQAAHRWHRLLKDASLSSQLIIKSLIAIGQIDRIFFQHSMGEKNLREEIKRIVDQLLPVEEFYATLGGVVGYHVKVLHLLLEQGKKKKRSPLPSLANYHPPEGWDLSEEGEEVDRFIWAGIHHLPQLGEIYPVGGAADRLALHDGETGIALPAAKLPFLGKTLLEGMITDLQSREYLYYKLFGKQLTTPLAMMTSKEKENHDHIVSICRENHWFGRPEESFRFFCQSSVPTINKRGQWCLQQPRELLLKPGGHGVIWKRALDTGTLEWFFRQGREKALVRQINNPVANTDYGLIAFLGVGFLEKKTFGFASCPRRVKASEGINVILEIKRGEQYEYTLTNIEYCDFKRLGIVDSPIQPKSLYSKFPSNTNILFVDLRALVKAVEHSPLPGALVNVKKLTHYKDNGEREEKEIIRLESTMQNIADSFIKRCKKPLLLGERDQLDTFLTYNVRRKTISAAKRGFTLGNSLLETPEGCFLDILHNGKELLGKCGVRTPAIPTPVHFFTHGPSFIFLYHPALGPLYSIIAQKIRGGVIRRGGELQLNLAEVDLEKVDIRGSLLISAGAVMGHKKEGKIFYSEQGGKCTLKNVKIHNAGIDAEASNIYWKNEITRHESCRIIVEGSGEFYAENLTLPGNLQIMVPNGFKMRAIPGKDGEVLFSLEKISRPTWAWKYRFTSEKRIEISREGE